MSHPSIVSYRASSFLGSTGIRLLTNQMIGGPIRYDKIKSSRTMSTMSEINIAILVWDADD
jgi:hypothetical protein